MVGLTKEQRAVKVAQPEAGGEQVPATVRMHREPATNAPPYSADVHPDEVANYQRAGWQLTE